MADNPVSIGILEDDADMRGYLSGLLGDEAGMAIAFSCGTLAEARAAVAEGWPDLCLVDIRLPDGSGLDFLQDLKDANEAGAQGHALILTVLGDRASVLLAFEMGANGYLMKDTPPQQILRDVRAVLAGGNPISPQAASHLLSLMRSRPAAADAPQAEADVLTSRELDVLQMFSRGLSYREAAETLGISVHTVSDHVKAIYAKMAVHSKNEAVYEAVRNGWLEM
ncbi:response regulator [Paraurantiacibacter namhicola]|uniref:Transcriptional regulatory protein DegU n=1 Tax=Paraurantiacibacter namhicola TaxID=645517 RepID=A0A1C7D7Y8_9SPHN|nr:response regulator transcription factor [Paraurantiacibacter namhicola]ANU07431.1 Transcriptional regulatory protein DegU [Paraurantiacibacter namhicola]